MNMPSHSRIELITYSLRRLKFLMLTAILFSFVFTALPQRVTAQEALRSQISEPTRAVNIAPEDKARRPNVVFVLTDDQAPWAIGVSGYQHADTPHMDRLAKEGAYLTNAYVVTPVCSPSRASLMTSRYGSELGITDWIKPGKEQDLGLDPAWVTWPELFQQAGYKTGLVGKWHLGIPDRFHPTKTGFDYFMGFRSGGNTPVDPTLEKDGVEQQFKGFTPDILTEHALEFLEDHQSDPFLLCLHYRAPHARWLPVAEEDLAPFDGVDIVVPNPHYPKLDIPRVQRMTREYLASTRSVDRNLGRVLAKLDDLELQNHTVVIFTSDHGYSMGHNGIWHKGNGHWVLTEPPEATETIPRNQRPNMYDLSIRVPTLVRWPGVVAENAVIDQTVSNLDWYPTLLSIAGIPLPDDILVRGRDMTSLLRQKDVEWNNDLYAEYSTHHQSQTHMRMYRTPRWKLIRDFRNEGRDELYDLLDDPDEAKNLIHMDVPEVIQAIAELDDKILKAMKENEDPVYELALKRFQANQQVND